MKTTPNVNMKEPKQFFALWRDTNGKWHQFDTNNPHNHRRYRPTNPALPYGLLGN